MKARTKLQIRVTELSLKLPRLTDEQEHWARKNCLKHKGYATKSRVLCMDCGGNFSPELVSRKSAICPHCETKLSIIETRKRKDKQLTYFATAMIVEDFQVIRYFDLLGFYRAGKAPDYYCRPTMEHWILPDGKREVIGFIHQLNYYQDSWYGKWAIREKHYDKYDLYHNQFHPSSKFKPEYLKYGINRHLLGLTFLQAIKIIPNEPKAETFMKAKRFDLLGSFPSKSYEIRHYWPSIKICMKNKYRPYDVGIWFDYLELLEYFGMDLHNAKYVCPRKLKTAHDRLEAKKRERLRNEEVERKRIMIEEAQVRFAEKIKRFSGFCFTNGTIVVKVLETVKEFEQEGDALKHCVFTNDYYTKENSLILSARINDEPVETIEVSLKTMKIQQSRGLRNQPSEYNKEIVKLVKKNLPKIKQLYLQKSA